MKDVLVRRSKLKSRLRSSAGLLTWENNYGALHRSALGVSTFAG